MNLLSPSPALATRLRGTRFAMTVAIGFILMTVLAMLVYPGGTITQPDNTAYDFFRNFFSDLGRTHNFRGEAQWGSFILFSSALTLAGIAFLVFFREFPAVFRKHAGAQRLARYGTYAGWLAAICYMGIAATPWNHLGETHMLFVKTGMLAFLVAAIFYAMAILRCPGYPRSYAYVWLAFVPILMGYIYLLFWGPSSKTPEGLIIQATWQKALVYSEILTLLIQGRGILRREAASPRTD